MTKAEVIQLKLRQAQEKVDRLSKLGDKGNHLEALSRAKSNVAQLQSASRKDQSTK